MKPNYEKYSIDDLYEALSSIDRTSYPERVHAINNEIKKRENLKDSNSNKSEEIQPRISKKYESILIFFIGTLGIVILYIFISGFETIKSTDVYKKSLKHVIEDSELIQILGTPIEEDGLVTGSTTVKLFELEKSYGITNFQIPISGPNGSAMVYVDAEIVKGKWIYHLFKVVIDKTNQKINMIPRIKSK